jgi:hypothetical protein
VGLNSLKSLNLTNVYPNNNNNNNNKKKKKNNKVKSKPLELRSRVKIYFIKLKILKYIYLSIKYFFKRLIMHLVLDLYRSSKKSSSTSSSSEVTQTEGLLVYGDPGSLGRSLDELRKSFKIS